MIQFVPVFKEDSRYYADFRHDSVCTFEDNLPGGGPDIKNHRN